MSRLPGSKAKGLLSKTNRGRKSKKVDKKKAVAFDWSTLEGGIADDVIDKYKVFINSNGEVGRAEVVEDTWKGVPKDLRRFVWPYLSEDIKSVPKLTDVLSSGVSLADDVLEIIKDTAEMNFENSDELRVHIEKTVTALHLLHSPVRFIPGSVRMTEFILRVCDNKIVDSSKVLTGIYRMLNSNLENNFMILRWEALLVKELIAEYRPDLARLLNSAGVSVVDLSDIIISWMYELDFGISSQFVLRFLDIVLANGEVNGLLGRLLYLMLDEGSSELSEEKDGILRTLYSYSTRLSDNTTIERLLLKAKNMGGPRVVDKMGWDDYLKIYPRGLFHDRPLQLSPLSANDDKVSETEQAKETLRIRLNQGHPEGEEEGDSLRIMELTLEDVIEIEDAQVFYEQRVASLMEHNEILRVQLSSVRQDSLEKARRIGILESQLERLELTISAHDRHSGTENTRTLTISKVDPGVIRFMKDLKILQTAGSQLIPIPLSVPSLDKSNYNTLSLEYFPKTFSTIYNSIEMPCVYMEGYLNRVSKGIFGRLSLTRKWFVLKGSYLTYFKNQTMARPQKDRCIDLSTFRYSRIGGTPEMDTLGKHCFQLRGSEITFVLYADTESDLHRWYLALRVSCKF